MSKNWLLVVLAAAFEVTWVAGLKYADSVMEWGLTMVSIAVSFVALIYSGRHLPASTVYAIFVGLGTAGTVIAEMIWFDVPFHWGKAGFIALLLVGMIGLKLVTKSSEEDQTRGERS